MLSCLILELKFCHDCLVSFRSLADTVSELPQSHTYLNKPAASRCSFQVQLPGAGLFKYTLRLYGPQALKN